MSLLKRLFGTQKASRPSTHGVDHTASGAMQALSSMQVVEPFAKVVYWPRPNGGLRVRAYILVERTVEGAQTGLALDGSGSMAGAYGRTEQEQVNIVSPLAQRMCSYLARQLDADGGTTVIYWATGQDGAQIEEVGDFTAEEAENHTFSGPQSYGRFTRLRPAVQYFVERFADAEWGMYIFVTDGALHDLDDVRQYSARLAREIADGRRRKLKLVLIGVGSQVDEAQMVALDNLDTGTDVDLWDHKIATQMQHLAEIFAEAVDQATIVAPYGLVRDENGAIVCDYRDSGLPALLEFDLPPGSASFTLEVEGQIVTQRLSHSHR